MQKGLKKKLLILGTTGILATTPIIQGCASTGNHHEGRALMTIIGGLAGAAIGHDLGGAAIGAGAGYIIGNEIDSDTNARETNQRLNNLENQANSPIIGQYIEKVPNENGSYNEIKIRILRDGRYVGEKGEYYNQRPTISQLKQFY